MKQFSMEENEGTPYSGKISRQCHHHQLGYDSPEGLCPIQTTLKLRTVAACKAEEFDSGPLKQNEFEAGIVTGPWPSLHINIDNKAEEKQLSEKGLHSPVSPAGIPDHLKCNILKAQMDAAFRVMTEGGLDVRSNSSGQEHNGRFLTSSQDSVSSSMNTEKPPVRSDRRKRLVRQYSFNHSDEDDLPAALAAISSQSSTGKTTSQSSLDTQIQPPIYPKGDVALLEIVKCCDRPLSPNKSSPFFPGSLPQLVPSDSAHPDSVETQRMELDREKLLRRLLMTEL